MSFLPVLRREVFSRLRSDNSRLHNEPDRHRGLNAVPELVVVLSSHQEWYTDHDLPLPGNCMVPGNPPKPIGERWGRHWGEGAAVATT